MKMMDAIIYVSGDDNWNQGIESSKEMCQKERLTSNSSMILPWMFLGKLFMSTEKRKAMSIERQ